MSLGKDLRYRFTTWTAVEKIISITAVVFVLENLLLFLFQLPEDFFNQWFALPKLLSELVVKPWTLLTYAFFHGGLMHIFWNMLLLYFAGRMFLNLFDGRRFLNVYFLGALAGGFFFLLSYNLFPVFVGVNSVLIGASAAVMAVLIFMCTYTPYQELQFFFFRFKLWHLEYSWYCGIYFNYPCQILEDVLLHLGGALWGFIYAKQLLAGNDIAAWFSNVMDWITNLFKPRSKRPFKKVYKNTPSPKSNPDRERQMYQQKIDIILDKISKSGYESLSKEEKDFLFRSGKE